MCSLEIDDLNISILYPGFNKFNDLRRITSIRYEYFDDYNAHFNRYS